MIKSLVLALAFSFLGCVSGAEIMGQRYDSRIGLAKQRHTIELSQFESSSDANDDQKRAALMLRQREEIADLELQRDQAVSNAQAQDLAAWQGVSNSINQMNSTLQQQQMLEQQRQQQQQIQYQQQQINLLRQ